MDIVFLGTGNAFGSGGRRPISILVQGRSTTVLLDCGPATLPVLKQLGRSAASIDLVLISHHHGDHFAGVPFLLLEYQFEAPRRRPLVVAGPPDTREKMEIATRLFFPGIDSKPRSFDLAYRDMKEGQKELYGSVEVLPFRAKHYSQGIAFSYRVRMEGRTVVYSGDTEWTDELGSQTAEADLFICECSNFDSRLEGHMAYRDLEAHRGQIGAERTILVHPGEEVLARRSELVFELADEGQELSL
jgi:ribonuclease BN (tRNA processing enzyme)